MGTKILNEKNLHAYQTKAVGHIIENPKAGLFLDMGLGKTVSTLTALKKLMFEDLEVGKTLIIAPKRVVETIWHTEVEKWSHLKGFKISKIIGDAQKRRAAVHVEADIYLVSRDNIAWLIGLFGGSSLPFDMLVIDESSSFKNPKSMRFKALRGVMASFDRVVLLTGTPAPNSLIDLWSQIFLLDRGERLGKFISNYRDSFFKPDKRNGHIVYNYKLLENSEQRIFEKIGDLCMSMKAKDYLDLPERVENTIELRFSDEQEQQYVEFEREKVLEMIDDDLEITAINAAALSNKLLQFANGAVYDEHKNFHEVHRLKIEALAEILEQGQNVLVAWTFRHDMYRMKDQLKKYRPRELKTEQDIIDWNEGKIKMLMMHPASGGHGLNLQSGGNVIVWFGQTWSLELYQQLNARLDRQGQKNAVVVNHLVVRGTVDEDVLSALGSKDGRQNRLMEAIKARIEKYV